MHKNFKTGLLLFCVGISVVSVQSGVLLQLLFGIKSSSKTKANKTLFEACQYGDLGAVTSFVNRNKEVIGTRSFLGNTPLNLAVQSGHLRVAYYLLEQGADMYAEIPVVASLDKPTPRVTALHSAAQIGSQAFCRSLLKRAMSEAQIDLLLNGVQGVSSEYTPLGRALLCGHIKCGAFLVLAGAEDISGDLELPVSIKIEFQEKLSKWSEEYTMCKKCFEFCEAEPFECCK